jgi:hypothetical protein
MTANKMPLRRFNEELIERFLSQHLPACRCGSLRQRWPHTVRAALKILLRFLRRERLLGTARPIDPPSVTLELQSFGHYQEHVCGLTQATREVSRHRVRAFLIDCFGGGAIRMATLREKDVTGFLTRYTVNCERVASHNFVTGCLMSDVTESLVPSSFPSCFEARSEGQV